MNTVTKLKGMRAELDAARASAGSAEDAGQRISSLAAELVVSGWMASDNGIEAAKKIAEQRLLDFACDEIERHLSAHPALLPKTSLDLSTQEEITALVREALKFYDKLDREHAPGEAALLDRIASALRRGRFDYHG